MAERQEKKQWIEKAGIMGKEKVNGENMEEQGGPPAL